MKYLFEANNNLKSPPPPVTPGHRLPSPMAGHTAEPETAAREEPGRTLASPTAPPQRARRQGRPGGCRPSGAFGGQDAAQEAAARGEWPTYLQRPK